MVRENTVLFEDARIVFRNFEGREGQYNVKGTRNFCVILDDDTLIQQLVKDGWNVKFTKPKDPDVAPQPYLPVAVSFSGRPPKVVMITSKGRTSLGEHEVEILDWVDIAKVDLIVRPYDWAAAGNTGRKAYLKTMFITIDEDYLERKYADMPLAIESGHDYIDGEVIEDYSGIAMISGRPLSIEE